MPELGELENVDMRDVWPDESKDFTPWIASNLSLLNKTLGLSLELRLWKKALGDSGPILSVLTRGTAHDS